MKSLSRLWSHRQVRGSVWTLFTLFTLAILIHQLINWQGARHLSEIRATLAAEGENLDFRAILPELIPDTENFCATPALSGIAEAESGEEGREALAVFDLKSRIGDSMPPPLTGAAGLGRRADLAPWINALTGSENGDAADLLAALSDQDAIVAELTTALDRPGARWTPQWRERELPTLLIAIPMPHFTTSQDLARSLALRSLASAATGDVAAAHASTRLLIRLSQASLGDPNFLGMLVGASHANHAVHVAWSLCETRTGTAGDFERLASDFTRLDFTEATKLAWRGEMAVGASTFETFGKVNRAEKRAFFGDGEFMIFRFAPRGLVQQNTANLARLQWTLGLQPLKEGGLAAMLESSKRMEGELAEMRRSPLRRPGSILATLFLPSTTGFASAACHAETLVTQARLACDLERYFLAHQFYPATLTELGDVPMVDLWSGAAMRYERTPDGRYRLWSIGPDRIDDGGIRTLDPKNPEKTRFRDPAYKGDWVWSYTED